MGQPDTCFRFAGADGAVCELACSSQRLSEVSPLLRQALDPDPREAVMEPAPRDALGRKLLSMANPRFSTEAVADAVLLMHHQPGGGSTPHPHPPSGGTPLLRQLRTLWVLDWLQALDHPAVRACAAEMMAQVPALAATLGPAGFVAAHLADLPPAALAAAPASALSLLAAVLVANREPAAVMEDLCDMLRAFDAACAQHVASLLPDFSVRSVLDWVAATAQPPADAARLALLRCPPVLVARWLVARRVLTRDLFGSVITANMHRMALPDFAALACFTPLAAEAHPHLVRLALQRQNTAVQLQDSAGRRVVSIKMHADSTASCATLRVESLVSVSAVGDDITVKFHRHGPSGGYEVFALADRSSTVFTSVAVRATDNNGTGSRVLLHNEYGANALGSGNRYVLLVPCAHYWATA